MVLSLRNATGVLRSLAFSLPSKKATRAEAAAADQAKATPSFTVERRPVCIADLELPELRALIDDLNNRADQVGCVCFDGSPGSTAAPVVIFAGSQERFHMLSVARHLSSRLIFFQDTESGWYQGSNVLPNLAIICEHFLARELGNRRALFFGQSAGAYAALIASTFVSGSTVIACSPQTFSDATIKEQVHFINIRPLSPPSELLDVRERLLARPDATSIRAIVIAAGEVGNPADRHYWMDYLHALRIHDVPTVQLFVVNANTHALTHTRVDSFARMISDLTNDIGSESGQKITYLRSSLQKCFPAKAPTQPSSLTE